jgi:O-antigen/teichoic acid export membrane protein
MTYSDLFAVQAALPGLAGGSAYGAASTLGRAVPMVLLPFTVALYPSVVAARAAGSDPAPLLRKALMLGGGVLAIVVATVALGAPILVDLILPKYTDAVWLVRWMPLATAPLGVAGLLAVYGLACERRVERVLLPACMALWSGFWVVGGEPAAVLAVLGGVGVATVAALARVTRGR